ncbi:MAG: tRNA 2-thiouridine(34) synthase MnmA [Candidatus Adlerbacteria bacterium]
MLDRWRTKLNIFGKKRQKVFVGLSGGVDSAVSAALLVRAGYDVTGVFIRIALSGYACSAGEDKIQAMRVAAHLRIPFIEIDLSAEYGAQVFAHSLGEFKKGNTPNPDTLCNREIKFGAFYTFARARGADYVATGHYAQTKEGKLYAGADQNKDQSYFLWMVKEDILKHTLFPVGGMQKLEVRALATKFGLPNARRKDSQGLCFLGDIAMEDMLARELTPVQGDVLSESGEVVGTHDGAVLYTLGERHGFTLFPHTKETLPHFVIAKNIEKNTITVSTDRFPQHATKTQVQLSETNWIGGAQPSVAQARFRYRQKRMPAEIAANKNNITLLEPHYVPAGQSLVLYTEEAGMLRCLGGGIVNKSELLS